MKKLLILSFVVVLLAGCKKDKDSNDTIAPTITVVSPSNNQAFAAGQSVHILANISDNDEIHEVHLYVTNVASGASIAHFEEHLDASNYTLDQTFTVQSGVNYKIEIDANDHADNTAQQIINVSGS